jgi:hypothetical protein
VGRGKWRGDLSQRARWKRDNAERQREAGDSEKKRDPSTAVCMRRRPSLRMTDLWGGGEWSRRGG